MVYKIDSSYDNSISIGRFYSLYLLKIYDDNIVSLIVDNNNVKLIEYGYTSFLDSIKPIYNGKDLSISFRFNSLFGINDIIFFNKSRQKLYSIIDTYSNKPINYLVKYDKNRIKYKYNSQDYDYIKNNNIKLSYTFDLNPLYSYYFYF